MRCLDEPLDSDAASGPVAGLLLSLVRESSSCDLAKRSTFDTNVFVFRVVRRKPTRVKRITPDVLN
eukprot:4897232-Alexandrium_andersonii.AAC.1